MADKIQKKVEGKTTIKMPTPEEFAKLVLNSASTNKQTKQAGSNKSGSKQVDYTAKALKDLRQVELAEFREKKKAQRDALKDRGWVMHSEMASFLSNAAYSIIEVINSIRGDLPPRVKISGAGIGVRSLPIEIAELNGELYAFSRIRFNRESGNGWGYSVDPKRSWEYQAPNGLGSWGPPRNGADLISLFNNGWDTHGKVIYYKKKYSYTQNNGARKRNYAKLNSKNAKAYKHTYRSGRTYGGNVKYVTRSKKDPLYYVTRIVTDGIDAENGVSVFLNDYLYTVPKQYGIYRSGFDNNISPWDYGKDYFLDQPF